MVSLPSVEMCINGWTSSSREERASMTTHERGALQHYGIVYHEYVPEDESVNAKFYVEVLNHLRECMRRTRLELWAENA